MSQPRSFMYVSDLVEGIWRFMQAPAHDPVNLGNPQEMTLLELAKRILRLTGSASQIVFADFVGGFQEIITRATPTSW